MRTTFGRPALETPYLAEPPPVRRHVPTAASDRNAGERRTLRHAATLAAIVAILAVVAALEGLLMPRGADAMPLWTMLAAAIGSVAIGLRVARLERRPASRRLATAAPRRPSAARATVARGGAR